VANRLAGWRLLKMQKIFPSPASENTMAGLRGQLNATGLQYMAWLSQSKKLKIYSTG